MEIREVFAPLTQEQRKKVLAEMIARVRFEHQWAAIDEAVRIIKEHEHG